MEISQGCRSRMLLGEHIGFSTSMIKVQKKTVRHHQMECIVCRREATAEHGNKSICAFNVFLEFKAQLASLCAWPRALSRPPPPSTLRSDVLQSITATEEAPKLWLQFIPHIPHLHGQSDSH